ncbi:MAG: ABC transporter ATP-binding protein [Hyphomicrobiaceae bacterium]
MTMLEIRGATKMFGNLVAVDKVSMLVAPGELRAIIGPNGAGKTTFFNLISGLVPPTTGEIIFDGRVVNTMSISERVALGMARTFQITEIFPELTLYENVRVGVESAQGLRQCLRINGRQKAAVDRGVEEALTQTGLTSKADRIVGELSHGDQRAAEIAMALTLHPRLLLLDEPTAGMGEHETFAIANLVNRLHRQSGYTIVLIEHDMRVVFNLADRITVLSEGKLLAEGTPDEIAANPVVQTAYLGSAA